MTLKEHKHTKHAKLRRKAVGCYGRNEISIMGTPCHKINKLAFKIADYLKNKYKVAYVDADHKNDEESINRSFHLNMTDKISFYRIDSEKRYNQYEHKFLLNELDFVIINGNHFETENQIIVVDPQKPLEKKLSKLKNVQLILLEENITAIPEYLKKNLADIESIPVFSVKEEKRIMEFFEQMLTKSIPVVNGLILAGGKSVRMTKDKGLLEYHGKPQREYLAELISEFCNETFISCRHDQREAIGEQYPSLTDTFVELGPLGAILSAFLTKEAIQNLINSRDPSKTATAYQQPNTEFPEPLIAIWEPKSYQQALSFLSLGYTCPRKVLINSDVKMIKATDDQWLRNINYPEEYEQALKQLKIQ